MQSSARNCLNVRVRTSFHSRAVSRSGPVGGRPTRTLSSAAVDEGEAANARLPLPFAAAPEDQARGRADPAGDEEAGGEGGGAGEREIRAQLRRNGRRLAHSFPQVVDCLGEALPLVLDLGADLLRRAAVGRHQCFSASEVSLASWIACSGTGG